MEQLNKVELRGIVGNASSMIVGDRVVTRFSVATDYGYTDKDGMPVVETTWHNCTVWSDASSDASSLERGKCVHLIGRIRMLRYVDASGADRVVTEILVQTLKIL